jgi:hypothetical protein
MTTSLQVHLRTLKTEAAMTFNPFEDLFQRLANIEEKLSTLKVPASEPAPEIIDRNELCRRLNITAPTAIRWEKKGKIPTVRIGSSVRYNWPSVIKALESK